MNRKFLWLLTVLLLTSIHLAEAQQAKKVPRIGFLGGSSASAYSSFIKAFRQGLRDLGYEDGPNIVIDYRYGEGKRDRLPDLSGNLVRLNVDVIVVSGTLAISALKNATKTIPIVMTAVEDPVTQALSRAWRGLAETSRDFTPWPMF